MSSRETEDDGNRPPAPAGGEDVHLKRATASKPAKEKEAYPPPGPEQTNHRTWASVAADNRRPKENIGRIPAEILAKLKQQTTDCVIVDPEVLAKCREKWKRTLFGKFLGRGLSLERLKSILARLWRGISGFSASDMDNGFYAFRFDKDEDMDYVRRNGPWTITGKVLKLIPWQNNFRPSLAAFDTAPTWVQFHNLPKEYWELEALIQVAAYFGKPLGVDETTMDHTRSHFARVCIEIDLSQPLKTVMWLGPKEDELEQTIIYESIPDNCYKCRRIGHKEERCKEPSKERKTTGGNGQAETTKEEVITGEGITPVDPEAAQASSVYGPWLTVQRKANRRPRAEPLKAKELVHPAQAAPKWHTQPRFRGDHSDGKKQPGWPPSQHAPSNNPKHHQEVKRKTPNGSPRTDGKSTPRPQGRAQSSSYSKEGEVHQEEERGKSASGENNATHYRGPQREASKQLFRLRRESNPAPSMQATIREEPTPDTWNEHLIGSDGEAEETAGSHAYVESVQASRVATINGIDIRLGSGHAGSARSAYVKTIRSQTHPSTYPPEIYQDGMASFRTTPEPSKDPSSQASHEGLVLTVRQALLPAQQNNAECSMDEDDTNLQLALVDPTTATHSEAVSMETEGNAVEPAAGTERAPTFKRGRGAMKKEVLDRCRDLNREHKMEILVLLETHADWAKAATVAKAVGRCWSWFSVPAVGSSGGIIVMWKTKLGWQHLWDELLQLAAINIPWVVAGDFNAYLSTNEKKSCGTIEIGPKGKAFADFIEAAGLCDLGFEGLPYTWCNNQAGSRRIWVRLDRVLANTRWLGQYPMAKVRHLDRTASDHAPLLLSTPRTSSPIARPFRYELLWLEYKESEQIARDVWVAGSRGNPMHTFTHKICQLQAKMKRWSRDTVGDLEAKLVDICQELEESKQLDAAGNLPADELGRLRSLYHHKSALSRQINIKWLQRSRLQWVQEGD
ncbi:uncharacterized protein [Typha angustifolia]|uniref:uncharacterized protein n=1 Tax=Typha angustifolia TaxID=59011 RepID=UPI003C2AF6F0